MPDRGDLDFRYRRVEQGLLMPDDDRPKFSVADLVLLGTLALLVAAVALGARHFGGGA